MIGDSLLNQPLSGSRPETREKGTDLHSPFIGGYEGLSSYHLAVSRTSNCLPCGSSKIPLKPSDIFCKVKAELAVPSS